MKKELLFVIISAIIIVGLTGIIFFLIGPTERPPTPAPIEIFSPQSNEDIYSPLKIFGTVGGADWTGFEGQVGTVKLLDNNGKELTSAVLLATTPWTTLPTNFEANLNFISTQEQNGNLFFSNENPSDLPENNRTFSLPVKIAKSQNIEVGVFFGNQALSSSSEQDECRRVYKSNRYVNQTQAVAKAAIEELLEGPTDTEKNAGFFTSIPVGSKLNSISIVNGEARADFNAVTESGGGSCSMAARVAQITQTLLQFPTITSVKLSIDGRTGDILQP